MTENCYIIDTSSLVELNKHNPMDVYPGVWQRIEQLIGNLRMLAPREVFYEISRMDDQLKEWAKKQGKLFVDPTQRQIELVKEILQKYPSLINIGRPYDADPWVIALSVELVTNPQKTLYSIKRIIVTEERLRGNRVRIPFVSKDYQIESINIIGMFREEGWRF
jgi:Domain of unknown function (DUF4411)